MSKTILPDISQEQQCFQQIRGVIHQRMNERNFLQVPLKDTTNGKKGANKLVFTSSIHHLTRYGSCSYMLLVYFHIHSDLKHVSWFLTIQFMSLEGQAIQLSNYSEMIYNFSCSFNRLQIQKKVSFQIQLSKAKVSLPRFEIRSILSLDFISTILNQIMSGFILKILENIQFQNQLTRKNLDNLAVNRTIIERNIDFRKNQRISFNRSYQQKKIASHQASKKIMEAKIIELMKNPIFAKPVYSLPVNFDKLMLKQSQKHSQIPGLLKQYEDNTDLAAFQTSCSIYEMLLYELNTGKKIYQKKKIKSSPNMICQGIQIKEKIKTAQNSITTSLSSLQFFTIIFKFNQSVHNNNFDELHEKTNQTLRNLDQNQPPDQNYDLVTRNLAAKRCLRELKKLQEQNKQQGNKKAQDLNQQLQKIKKLFANQYKFIKSIRNRIFPYIAQYYLQTEKVVQDSKQTLEQVIQKTLYMDYYQLNFNQYIISESGPFKKLNNSKILAIFIQIASTLRYFERIGILHRDIKHINIMVDKFQKVRFIDWGSCSLKWEEEQNKKKRNPDILSFNPYSTPIFTSVNWSQTFSDMNKNPQYEPILNTYFGGSRERFDRNEAFDIYSFGVLIQIAIGKMKQKHDQIGKHYNWIMNELIYLMSKSQQVNPYDRPKPIDILLYLNELMKISQEKKLIISKINRDSDGYISSVEL